jgi:3-hydroxyacyl-CoA dehydrogenase
MSDVVSYQIVDNIGVVSVDSPPVNALSQKVREGILNAVTAAQGDACEAIVLRCDGRTFIAGADITEFGKCRWLVITAVLLPLPKLVFQKLN